jgi:hypothetical protein
MALITQSELEKRIGRTLSADEVQSFAVINNSLQAYVERMIGSKVESVSPSTRYYDGGVQHLEIDPCVNITEVKYVDDSQATESVLLTTDYTLEPINRNVKTMLRRNYARFNYGMNNVAVTAKFSIYDDTDTLNIVKNAMLDVLSDIMENKEDVKRESIEGYSVDFDTMQKSTALKALDTIRQGII